MKITRRQAVDQSIEKWTKILNGHTELGIDICGFCKWVMQEAEELLNSDICLKFCPLYPKVCSCEVGEGIVPLYWRWKKYKLKCDAQKMLDAIKDTGESWVSEECKGE